MKKNIIVSAGFFISLIFLGVFCGFAAESKVIEDPQLRKLLELSSNQELILEKYIVLKGDWLLKIAEREYGNGELWKVIVRYNPGIKNPNRIEPGEILDIPRVIDRPQEEPRQPELAVPEVLEIATFNAGLKENRLGGAFGAWDKDIKDRTQSCIMDFEPDITASGRGQSLKLIYDVDSPNPAYNGLWMDLAGADLTQYNHLVFTVKGEKDAGFTENFKIEIKDTDGKTDSFILDGITANWQEKRVPLVYFKKIDISSTATMVIVFEDNVASPKTGIIYIDNIRVE